MRNISAVFCILMFYEIASYPISNMFVSTDAHVRLKETGGLNIEVILSTVANIPAELRSACQQPGNLFQFIADPVDVSTPVILHFRTL